MVKEFERQLQGHRGEKGLDEARPEDLKEFAALIELEPIASAKSHLWAIRYYYEFTVNQEMVGLACELRQKRIKRTPFRLGKFRGVNQEHVEKLAAYGIENVEQMLNAGRTLSSRQALAEKTGVPLEAILEFVKLSDLARIPGLKSIRARLYYDSGVDTTEKLSSWDPEELRAMLTEFVERTGFNGIAPLPKEAQHAVTTAKKLPKMVGY
ncbi:unnamed protein product [marine sediment metagenome]|uniref:DUF4332 domain-containing protein n=1 Tax=marine sediment metagenome TaxID=412755 RepID=X0ZYS4_9ZZZZ